MRAFRVAYDGSRYRGFQRQPHGETIEDELFAGLGTLGVEFEGGSPVGYAAAGRTDAGVSARAQTVAFEAPEWLSPRALNGEVSASIRAWAAADATESFHATHDAVERTYRYVLYGPTLDDELAFEACRRLSGKANFYNFTPDKTDTERTVSMSARRRGAFLLVDCRAGGFDRQLVRRLIGLLEAIAEGSREPAFVDRALDPEPLSGPDGIAPAAPEPLVLFGVRYPNLGFEIDRRALESAREIFETRRRRHLAAARVADSLLPEGR